MPVHDVAARGFGSAADAYERGRPTYPAEALTFVTEHLGLGPGAAVCDLGAGTGKLTRLLAPTGCDLVAVEPLAGMRAVLAGECPEVPAVAATAEALPLRTGSLDAVLAAQAFHWFDTGPALDEITRALRRGGRVALMWNAWDGRVPWVARIHRLVADAGSTAEWQRGHFSRAWAGAALAAHDRLGPVTEMRFPHDQPLDREGIVERVATTSHIVSSEPAARDAVLAEVRRVLDDDPATRDEDVVRFPYVTEIFVSTRA